MRLLISLYILILPLSSHGQEIRIGKYRDSFGSQIELMSDSTFSYVWRMDMMSSWTNGIWDILNDTIRFTQIPLYDTLVLDHRDSLVVSLDSYSTRISKEYHAMYSLGTGGQNNYPMPNKLYYKNEKLYLILVDGELDREKRQGGMVSTKFNTWYSRYE